MKFYFSIPKSAIENAWIQTGRKLATTHTEIWEPEELTPAIRALYRDTDQTVDNVELSISFAIRPWKIAVVAPVWEPGKTSADMLAELDRYCRDRAEAAEAHAAEAERQIAEWVRWAESVDLETIDIDDLGRASGWGTVGGRPCPEGHPSRQEAISEMRHRAAVVLERRVAQRALAAEARKAKADAEAQAAVETERRQTEAWIAEFGSARLKRLVNDGYQYGQTYRKERAAIERPGYVWEQETCGEAKSRANPEEHELSALDAARAAGIEDAHLVWVSTTGRGNHCAGCAAADGGDCDGLSGPAIECELLGETYWKFVTAG